MTLEERLRVPSLSLQTDPLLFCSQKHLEAPVGTSKL